MRYEPYTPVSSKIKDIQGLDWNEQWDITTSTGEKYISMTIARREGMILHLSTPEIPEYGQLLKAEMILVDIHAIQVIEKSPLRHVYLYCSRSPVLLWDLVYLSLSEKESIPTDSFDTVLDTLAHGVDMKMNVWGNGVVLRLERDEFGRCHMKIGGKSTHSVFVRNFRSGAWSV